MQEAGSGGKDEKAADSPLEGSHTSSVKEQTSRRISTEVTSLEDVAETLVTKLGFTNPKEAKSIIQKALQVIPSKTDSCSSKNKGNAIGSKDKPLSPREKTASLQDGSERTDNNQNTDVLLPCKEVMEVVYNGHAPETAGRRGEQADTNSQHRRSGKNSKPYSAAFLVTLSLIANGVNKEPTGLESLQVQNTKDFMATMDSLQNMQSPNPEAVQANLEKISSLLLSTTSTAVKNVADVQLIIGHSLDVCLRFRDIQGLRLGCAVLALLAKATAGVKDSHVDFANEKVHKGISAVQKAMDSYSSDLVIQQEGCKALCEWSNHSSLHPFMADSKECRALLTFAETMNSHLSSVPIQEAGLQFLLNFARNKKLLSRNEIMEALAVWTLQAMQAHRNVQGIQNVGACCMAECFRGGLDVTALGSTEHLQVLLNATRVLGEMGKDQSQLWLLLLRVSNSICPKVVFSVCSEAIQRASFAIQEEITDAFSVTLKLRFLEKLGTCLEDLLSPFPEPYGARCKRSLHASCTVQVVLEAMQLHIENHHLLSDACELLMTIVARWDPTALFPVANSWLKVTANVLENHGTSRPRMVYATLWPFAFSIELKYHRAKDFLLLAEATGFVTLAMEMLNQHKWHESMAPVGCAVLGKCRRMGLKFQAAIISGGGVSFLIKALAFKACGAIQTLFFLLDAQPEEVTQIILVQDGLSAIVAALDADASDFIVGCMIMKKMVDSAPLARDPVFKSKAIDAVLLFMAKESGVASTQVAGCIFLASIVCPEKSPTNREVKQYIKARDGLGIVFDAMVEFENDRQVMTVVGPTFNLLLDCPEECYARVFGTDSQ